MERTIVLIKPHVLDDGLLGDTLTRFEDEDFKIINLKLTTRSSDWWREFYLHVPEPILTEMVDDFANKPFIMMELEQEDAINLANWIKSKLRNGVKGYNNYIHTSSTEGDYYRERDLCHSYLY